MNKNQSTKRVDQMLKDLFNMPEIVNKEKELYNFLLNALLAVNSDGNCKDQVYEEVLSYLESNQKLLRDAVYPHLCTEIPKMKSSV